MIVTLFTYRYYVRFAGIFINIKLKKRSSFVGQRDVLMQVFFMAAFTFYLGFYFLVIKLMRLTFLVGKCGIETLKCLMYFH